MSRLLLLLLGFAAAVLLLAPSARASDCSRVCVVEHPALATAAATRCSKVVAPRVKLVDVRVRGPWNCKGAPALLRAYAAELMREDSEMTCAIARLSGDRGCQVRGFACFVEPSGSSGRGNCSRRTSGRPKMVFFKEYTYSG